jgi:3-oxoacyl-[acyl-carrier-protein] synthase II
MKVVVTGIGLVSALGSLDTTWKQLLAKETGIRLSQPFAELAATPLALIGSKPTDLEFLTNTTVLAALADARLEPPLLDCGVSVGSSRGNQAKWEWLMRKREQEIGKREQETRDKSLKTGWLLESWLETLPNAAAVIAARLIQTQTVVLSPMAACATGIWAIAQGVELIRTGQCRRVLAGAVEAPITPLTLAGFEQMGALAKTGAYPFDRDRQGMVLGEGGAILVLESAELAAQRSAQVYGQILGFGLSADGYHISAPKVNSQAAIAAMQQCLRHSQLDPTQIDMIHAHGTATPLNDRNEAGLIQYLFSQRVPVISTKGATGHTLGASGALGIAFCLLALQQQLLPPCVGLSQPEFDLNFVVTPRLVSLQHALCLSFGFGGQNAAIALRHTPLRI